MHKLSTFLGILLLSISSNTWAQDAKIIHNSAIVVDTHGDILHNQIKSGVDLAKFQPSGQFDLIRAKAGGLDVQIFAVWSDEKGNYKAAIEQIDSLNALIKRNPDKIELVNSSKSVLNAVKNGKLAALIGVEGGHMIDENLDYIDSLASKGMIYLTLTWNNSLSWASSAADESKNKVLASSAGLNDFGKSVIARLNKVGVMVDLSHVGEKTFYDALKYTTKPVLVSHSSVHSINPVPRNLTDDQIKAIGKNGGVISVNFYSGFLDPEYDNNRKKFFDKYESEIKSLTSSIGRSKAIDSVVNIHIKEAQLLGPSIDKIADHIDHIVKLIGVNHVGIGADFDGAESFPQGMNSVADFPKLTEVLNKRGYSKNEIHKILGGNFLRLLKDIKGI
ncbi:dipeptidase [Pedobacter flavus]|uniref:Dipeptidase n=1 Tax=Pedobacter flavus TaxID=3113906 RepID=A0ABU7H3B7_9SPHI|nr:dipeptidase [Pedobacter sp. VNH31]MEE1885749.1 dipeptidase [Pedobacter sp. VNH31]